jgi:hypothetical protein
MGGGTMGGMAGIGSTCGGMGHGSSGPSYAGSPNGGQNGSMGGGHGPGPTFGGQQQMSPAMTQPMAPVRPQGGPQPLQQAPTPMRGFLIDEDDN